MKTNKKSIIMNYEEKYKNALERAKKLQEKSNGMILKKWLWNIFPELKESEDERIRKAIISCLKYIETVLKWDTVGDVDILEAYAWLEKQGEQKRPIEKLPSEMKTIGESLGFTTQEECDEYNQMVSDLIMSDSDKFKTKFNVGDWIITKYMHLIMRILNNDNGSYKTVETDGTERKDSYNFIERNFKLWSIKDAKDGDVLSYRNGQGIFIYKGKLDDNSFYYHALYSTIHQDLTINGVGFTLLGDVIIPATKEQRDLLFQKMKETGYEWDVHKKELKNIEPKFNVGDWIVTPKNKVLQITNIEGTSYRFNNESHYWEICYCDEQCHLWTIKDAKSGDVLINGDKIVIFKENCFNQKDLSNSMFVHCRLHNKNSYWYTFGGINPSNYIPATKEQRDFLFQKMKEAGYAWNDEKKELKKVEQKVR